MSDLFINKKVWSTYTDRELQDYIKKVFYFYREKGFPYFPTSREFRDKELAKLKNYDFTRVIDRSTKTITQSMHGLSLAWSYMPHSWSIPCGGKKTPMQVFLDDKDLALAITKRVMYGDNMSDNGLRKTLRIFTGAQSVSNFRPTAAAAIYSLFCPPSGTVWDMSCGFGGRLLGASLAGVNYVGTDPSTPTYEGLVALKRDCISNIDVSLHKIGSENYIPKTSSLDFCFTSPPYFDLEKYTEEDTQSYRQYPSARRWLNGFIRATFVNCFKGLKPNRLMAINVANTPRFKNLEASIVAIAEEVGFSLDVIWRLGLSNLAKTRGDKYKYEPIYIFKKPLDSACKTC